MIRDLLSSHYSLQGVILQNFLELGQLKVLEAKDLGLSSPCLFASGRGAAGKCGNYGINEQINWKFIMHMSDIGHNDDGSGNILDYMDLFCYHIIAKYHWFVSVERVTM